MRNLKPLVWLSVIVLILGMLIASACTPKEEAKKPEAEKPAATAPEVVLPTPGDTGIIKADQWKEIHPDIYQSYMDNANNSANPSYLDQYPFLVTIYDGMGFAKAYNEARGHVYTLTDIAATGRPHAMANCLTCKTPEMTVLVNTEGVGIYSTEYDEIFKKVSEPISCYSCHANTDGELVASNQYLLNALGSDVSKIDEKTLVCAQCHNEYYFDPETKATTLPWKGLSNMTPEASLAYYNDIKFSDFTNGFSGAGMIKVQHPEFETTLGAGGLFPTMNGSGFACGDCHMGAATNSDGEEYISHYWQSPLKNAALIDGTCKSCHADIAGTVKAIQDNTHERLVVIGNKLKDLHIKIGEAAENGASDEELATLRQEVRDAQFYYDYVFVENSYGAHNSALTKQLLDKAESMVDATLAKF